MRPPPHPAILGLPLILLASGCCRVGSHTCCTGVDVGLGSQTEEKIVVRDPPPATAPAEQGDIVQAAGRGHDRQSSSDAALEDALLRRDRLGFAGHRLRLLSEEFADLFPGQGGTSIDPQKYQCVARYRILEQTASGSASAAADAQRAGIRVRN